MLETTSTRFNGHYYYRVDRFERVLKYYRSGVREYGPTTIRSDGIKFYKDGSPFRLCLDPRPGPDWFFSQNFSFGYHYEFEKFENEYPNIDLSLSIVIEDWN